MRAIDKAIDAAGGTKTALGKKLGISAQAVSAWVEVGHVPLRRIREVSAATGVPVAELLMDMKEVVESEGGEVG